MEMHPEHVRNQDGFQSFHSQKAFNAMSMHQQDDVFLACQHHLKLT